MYGNVLHIQICLVPLIFIQVLELIVNLIVNNSGITFAILYWYLLSYIYPESPPYGPHRLSEQSKGAFFLHLTLLSGNLKIDNPLQIMEFSKRRWRHGRSNCPYHCMSHRINRTFRFQTRLLLDNKINIQRRKNRQDN